MLDDTVKPEVQTLRYVDFHDMMRFISKKYDIDQYNYARKSFAVDEDGKRYLNFWHWLTAEHMSDASNGWYGNISFIIARETAMEQEGSEWVVEILDRYIAEFSDFWNDNPEDGWFMVHVWW